MNILLFQLLSTPVYSDAWGMRRKPFYSFIDGELIKKGRKFYNGYDKFIKIENLNLPENTLILTYGARSSFFLAYFADKVPGIRSVMMKSYLYYYQEYDLYELNPWYDMKMEVLKNHQGPTIGLIVQGLEKRNIIFPEKEEYLKDKFCTNIYNNTIGNLILCVPPELKESIFADRN